VNYRDPLFDAMYLKIRSDADSPGRDALCLKAAERLATTCPWFFESHPVAFMLVHKWMKYFRPHDFGYSRWKYLSVDPELRDATRNAFSPISLDELRR
jgi:hypothetical protein